MRPYAIDYDWLIRPQDATRILYKNGWGDTWRRLMRAEAFGEWARDRGGAFQRGDIRKLWQMRLLRADAVRAKPDTLDRRLFIDAGKLSGKAVFADARPPLVSSGGLVGPLPQDNIDHDAEPLFHPYRLLVLRHLAHMAQLSVGRIQLYQNPAVFPKLVEMIIKDVGRTTAGEEVPRQIARLNDLVTIGALVEPLLVHHLSNPNDDAIPGSLSHWDSVGDGLRTLGHEAAQEFHHRLCIEGQHLDENRTVQTLLRLTLRRRVRSQLHLRGMLDGAFELRLFAEAWRRACETTFNVKWREEDELGFGEAPAELKTQLYDVPRLLDADDAAVADFTRLHFVDPRPTVRVYCEGETEVGFARAFFAHVGVAGVAVLPLRGHLGDRRNLIDVLEQNDQEAVFTFLVLDGDVKENVEAVRRSAGRDAFAGGFFVSAPDLELANFTLDELAEVAVRLAVDDATKVAALTSQIVAAGPFASAKDFERAARKILHADCGLSFKKGEVWGAALLRWAADHAHPSGAQRPVTDLLARAARAPRTLYARNKNLYRVDATTGVSVPRAAAPGAA